MDKILQKRKDKFNLLNIIIFRNVTSDVENKPSQGC